MVISNIQEGALIQHDKDLYDHQKSSLGKKVISDICNRHRRQYDQYLSGYPTDEEKKDFSKLLSGMIEDAERLLSELKFAKLILSRKKIIFKKGTQEDEI